MKTCFSALILVLTAAAVGAQTTAFTYQGRLNRDSNPANGNYDLRFTVWNAETGGSLASGTVGTNALAVSNGLFTVALDFGPGVFTGADRWLEINVRTNGGGPFDTLIPRQRLTATPYAITAGNVGSNGLAGTYGNAVTFSNSANSFRGTFTGNGSSVSNVNALTLGGIGNNGFWRTTGNAGTTPSLNFLGTTDDQPLELQVNGARALRIEPHATSAPSLVGGYLQNSVSGFHGAVVAGGGTSASANQVLGNYGFVGAGHGGRAGEFSAVVGGAYNVSPGQFSFVGSGEANTNQANYSFLGGGLSNYVAPEAVRAFIGGGVLNSNLADSAVIAGGVFNRAEGPGAFIGGGGNNAANDFNTVVSGGANNRALANASAVGGGSENTASADHSTISGGQGNVASGNDATVAGGLGNTASGAGAFVGSGGRAGSFIPFYSSAPGNTASGDFSVVGGGSANLAGGIGAFVGGGGHDGNNNAGNTSSGVASVIGGGLGNSNSGQYSTIVGGFFNTNSGDTATIAGGAKNLILPGSQFGIIPGGFLNSAGSFAFAAGFRAKANHLGAFVWADSQNGDFSSTGNNQFLLRAAGGVGINTVTPGAMLQLGDENLSGSEGMIRFASRAAAGAGSRHWDIGVPQHPTSVSGKFFSFVIDDPQLGADPEVMVRWDTGNVGIGVAEPGSRLHVGAGGVRCEMGLNQKFSLGGNGNFEIDAPGFVGGRFIVTDVGRVGMGRIPASNRLEVEGTASKSVAGDWLANSDRRIKTDIETITNALEKLEKVRLTSFRYTEDYRRQHPSIKNGKYLNVIAQEFQQVFPDSVKCSGDKLPNGDEILQVDTYPLTIYSAAALQELNRKVEKRETALREELKRRDAENAELKERLAALEKIVTNLTQTR